MNRRNALRCLFSALFLWLALLPAGCHSYHIDITIENRTGAAVNLLEVDYPSASFGADSLAPGASFHYRIAVVGSGPLTISYIAPSNKRVKIAGPNLAEHQQGRIEIVLLAGGKFHIAPRLLSAL